MGISQSEIEFQATDHVNNPSEIFIIKLETFDQDLRELCHLLEVDNKELGIPECGRTFTRSIAESFWDVQETLIKEICDFLIEVEHDSNMEQQFMRNHRNLYATAFEGIEDYQIKAGLSGQFLSRGGYFVQVSVEPRKSNSLTFIKQIMKCLITENHQCDINQNYHINSNKYILLSSRLLSVGVRPP